MRKPQPWLAATHSTEKASEAAASEYEIIFRKLQADIDELEGNVENEMEVCSNVWWRVFSIVTMDAPRVGLSTH